MQHFNLHILRHGRGQAQNIKLLGIQSHGLNEELVAGFVRESHNLGLDRRAVAGANAVNHAGIQRAAVQIFPDDPMGFLICVSEPADRPVYRGVIRDKGEGLNILVSGLDGHFGEVHRPPVDPGRRAGLEPAHGKAEAGANLPQRQGCGQPVGAGIRHRFADDGPSSQVGAGADDGGPAPVDRARCGGDGTDPSVFPADIDDFGLLDPEIFLLFQGVLHDGLVQAPVRLGPQAVYGRALAPVQHTVLYAGLVRGNRHFSAQSVQLTDEMALSRASDGRVAGHVANHVQMEGEANRINAEARRSQRGLNTRVARADDGNITFSCIIVFHNFQIIQLSPVRIKLCKKCTAPRKKRFDLFR